MSDVRHVLLPVCDVAEAEALLPLARAIAQGWKGHVLLFGIVRMSGDKSLSEGVLLAQVLRQELERLAAADPLVDMLPTAKVTYSPWNEIGQQVDQAEYDLCTLRLLRRPRSRIYRWSTCLCCSSWSALRAS